MTKFDMVTGPDKGIDYDLIIPWLDKDERELLSEVMLGVAGMAAGHSIVLVLERLALTRKHYEERTGDFQAAVTAAMNAAEYELDYDYGYGGDTYQCDRVGNWHEIVAAAISAYKTGTQETTDAN